MISFNITVKETAEGVKMLVDTPEASCTSKEAQVASEIMRALENILIFKTSSASGGWEHNKLIQGRN